MKLKDKQELHGLKPEMLKKKVSELRNQLRHMYLDMRTKEMKNRKVAKELRKRLAVALSILRIKEIT